MQWGHVCAFSRLHNSHLPLLHCILSTGLRIMSPWSAPPRTDELGHGKGRTAPGSTGCAGGAFCQSGELCHSSCQEQAGPHHWAGLPHPACHSVTSQQAHSVTEHLEHGQGAALSPLRRRWKPAGQGTRLPQSGAKAGPVPSGAKGLRADTYSVCGPWPAPVAPARQSFAALPRPEVRKCSGWVVKRASSYLGLVYKCEKPFFFLRSLQILRKPDTAGLR